MSLVEEQRNCGDNGNTRSCRLSVSLLSVSRANTLIGVFIMRQQISACIHLVKKVCVCVEGGRVVKLASCKSQMVVSVSLGTGEAVKFSPSLSSMDVKNEGENCCDA